MRVDHYVQVVAPNRTTKGHPLVLAWNRKLTKQPQGGLTMPDIKSVAFDVHKLTASVAAFEIGE